MTDLEYHQSLFDQFQEEIDAENIELTKKGCICGYNTAQMANAGTKYVEFITDEGYFDEQCPVHGEAGL